MDGRNIGILKIFNTETKTEVCQTNKQEKFYFCRECQKVIEADISNGTGPLITHQQKHDKEHLQTQTISAGFQHSVTSNDSKIVIETIMNTLPTAFATVAKMFRENIDIALWNEQDFQKALPPTDQWYISPIHVSIYLSIHILNSYIYIYLIGPWIGSIQ